MPADYFAGREYFRSCTPFFRTKLSDVSRSIVNVSEKEPLTPLPMLTPDNISCCPFCSQASYFNVAMLIEDAFPPFSKVNPCTPSIPGIGSTHCPSIETPALHAVKRLTMPVIQAHFHTQFIFIRYLGLLYVDKGTKKRELGKPKPDNSPVNPPHQRRKHHQQQR